MIKKKIWTGNTDLEVINILMLLEAMKLKCTNKREFKKKKKKGWGWSWLGWDPGKYQQKRHTESSQKKTEVTREMHRKLKEYTITKAQRKRHFKKRRAMGSNSKSLHNKI